MNASVLSAQSSISIVEKRTREPQDRVSDYRRTLVNQLVFQMLNDRFDEMSRKADAPFLSAGVYGGAADPLPLLIIFDKQLNLRMGQANVKRWIDDILPLVSDDADPLGVESFATHRIPITEAPGAYERFQKKQDNTFKILLQP